MNHNLTFVVISSTNDLSVEKTLRSIVGVGKVLLIDGGARKHVSNSQENISLSSLAAQYACEYEKRNFDNASNQYNFGIQKVVTEWAFIIDSDETLSPELSSFLESGKFVGVTHFSIKRFNHFLGNRMRYGQFRPDWNIRLIRTDSCNYEPRPVHARMLTKGKGGKAPGYMVHETVQDIDAFFLKMIVFTKNEIASRKVKDISTERKAKYRSVLQRLPFQSTLRFIYSYWFKFGFLDGRRGYLLAKCASFYEVMVKLHSLDQDG